jgi:hypothetical protein
MKLRVIKKKRSTIGNVAADGSGSSSSVTATQGLEGRIVVVQCQNALQIATEFSMIGLKEGPDCSDPRSSSS